MNCMQIIQVITWRDRNNDQNYMRFNLADSLEQARDFKHSYYRHKIAQYGGYHVIHNNQIKSVEDLIKEDPYFKRFKLVQ